jgi:hypothetical protein
MNRDALLQQILACSREILALAQAGDWMAGQACDARRHELIQACFAPGGRFADPAAAAATLRQILDIDRQSLALGLGARDEMRAESGRLRQGRAARLAYGRVSPD